MRGQLHFPSPNPSAAAPAFAEALAQLLRKAKPAELEVQGAKVFVRGGMFRFVSNLNLLASVTTATIEAHPAEREVIVRYEIRQTEVFVVCCLATLGVIPIAGITRSLGPALAWPVLVWGWLFGANWLATRWRMTRAFRKAAREVVQGAAT